MTKDEKILTDLLNKYKSELSELKNPKLTKIINNGKIELFEITIKAMKDTLELIKKI